MADSEELIKKQLEKRQIKRNADVRELYLGKNNLTSLCDLARFKNLQILYINSNKLRLIDCLSKNLYLSELYAHDNELKSISGSLEHLTCLEVLSLYNNQLQKLDKVVHELRNMHSLKSLNLFHNPVVQESEYRLYVIYHLPTLELLDRREILKLEREAAKKAYNRKRIEIDEKIAFGLRSAGPPSIYYPAESPRPLTVPEDYEVGNNFYRSNPAFNSQDDAVNVRHLRRSVMEYTMFDWGKVPRAEERRLSDKEFTKPQTITTRFR